MMKKIASHLIIAFLIITSCQISQEQPLENASTEAARGTSSVIASFSWGQFGRNPPDQKEMGPCHAYAAVGVIESMVRLFYNNPVLSVNLSERYAVSTCNPFADPYSGSSAMRVMQFTRDNGLVSESTAASYPSGNHPFFGGFDTAVCQSFSQQTAVTIPAYRQVVFNSHDELKRAILKYGPVVASMKTNDFYSGIGHGIQIVGWSTNSAGDTSWEVYDSWPESDSKYRGRHYSVALDLIKIQTQEYLTVWQVLPEASGKTINYTNGGSVRYYDNDGDGYYVWGIGPKPASCPGYAEPDGDDSDPLKGPRDNNGFCIALPEKVDFYVNSQGYTTVVNKTFSQAMTLRWSHSCYDIPVTGYYARISRGSTVIAYSDKNNRTRSGTFTVQPNVTYTFTVHGGTINSGGYIAKFYGGLRIYK